VKKDFQLPKKSGCDWYPDMAGSGERDYRADRGGRGEALLRVMRASGKRSAIKTGRMVAAESLAIVRMFRGAVIRCGFGEAGISGG